MDTQPRVTRSIKVQKAGGRVWLSIDENYNHWEVSMSDDAHPGTIAKGVDKLIDMYNGGLRQEIIRAIGALA